VSVQKILLVTLLTLSGVASAQFDTSLLPFINEEARSRIEKEYAPAKPHKALALTETGAWQFVQGAASVEAAVASAVSRCQDRNPRHPCFAAAEDDRLVVKQRYSPESIYESALGLLKRATLSIEYYSNENRDTGVAPTGSFRRQDVHAPTPLTVPGAKTITTRELVELLRTSNPVVVNVLPWKEGVFAIPGTIWLQGMGRLLYRAEINELQTILAKVAPDKAAPLVLYCLSWECWLSYNVALNALDLGYKNVLWYRGGGQAWDEANLPLVRAKLYARF
jgi:PQQ-dependent catabolism-associated CXXCW motif protein